MCGEGACDHPARPFQFIVPPVQPACAPQAKAADAPAPDALAPQAEAADALAPNAPAPQANPGVEKRFQCTHAGCGYKTDRSDDFKLHLASRHGAAGAEKQQKNRRLMAAAKSDRTTQVREKITGTASEGKGTCECRDKDCMCWQRANALLTITNSSVPANWTCESSSASPPRARFACLC
jgi:hypothetical protein